MAIFVQLDLLEDQRKMILSQRAFTIQCCWRRYQCRRHHSRQRSATLIQAGNLLKASSGNAEQTGAIWIREKKRVTQNSITRCVSPCSHFLCLLVLTSLSGQKEVAGRACVYLLGCWQSMKHIWLTIRNKKSPRFWNTAAKHFRWTHMVLKWFMLSAVVRSWLVRRKVKRWDRAAAVIQDTWKKWKVRSRRVTFVVRILHHIWLISETYNGIGDECDGWMTCILFPFLC